MKIWLSAFLPLSGVIAGGNPSGLQQFYFGADSHGPEFARVDLHCLEKKEKELEANAWVMTPNYMVFRSGGIDQRTALLTLYISIPRSTTFVGKKLIREFLDNPALRLTKYRSFILAYERSGAQVSSKVVFRSEAYDKLLEYFVMPRPRPAGCRGFKILNLQSERSWRKSLSHSSNDESMRSALGDIPMHSEAIDVIEREVEVLTTRKPPKLYILKLFTAVRGDEDPADTGKALVSGTLPLNRDYFVMEIAGDAGGESPKDPFGRNQIPPRVLQDLGARSPMHLERANPDYGTIPVTPYMIEDLYGLSKLPFEPGLPYEVTERPVWRLHRIPSRIENEGHNSAFEGQIAFSTQWMTENDSPFNDHLPPVKKKKSGIFQPQRFMVRAPKPKALTGKSFPVAKRRRSSEEILDGAEVNGQQDLKKPKAFGHDADDEMYEGIMSEQ